MQIKKIHSYFLIIFSLLAFIFYLLIRNNLIQDNLYLLFFSFFLILTLGVSHGALDHLRGKKIFYPLLKQKWFLFFYPGYILLSLIVISSWVKFPTITLLLFLLIASYHFGEEDLGFFLENKGIFFSFISFLKGLLIITASFHFNFETTALFFQYLFVPSENYQTLIHYKTLLFSVNLILLVIGLINLLRNQIDKLVLILMEVLLIVISFKYLPLILAFTLYFCFLHSSKHILGLSKELDPGNITNGLKLFVIKAAPLTVLTAIVAVLFVILWSESISENIIKTIFIGLASLTLPHILLEVLDKK